MRRRQQRNAARSSGRGIARVISVPLPLSGLFAESKNAEFSGLYASELINLKSNGMSLEVGKSYTLGSTQDTALRRIPFEFGAKSQYVRIRSTRLLTDTTSFDRAVSADASIGYISSQLLIADGQGAVVSYDGETFTERTFTTSAGADAETLDGVLVHQDRPFFWKTDGALEFYYGDVGAVQGTLDRFPLDRLGNITGQIRGMASLTMSDGESINDNLCIMTTTGYIVIYQGLDPSDPMDWRQIARVKAAPPIAKDGFANIGGDIWMITPSGIVSVLDSLSQGVLALVGNVSRPVADLVRERAQKEDGRWQLHVAADGEQVIINHHRSADDTVQFVYSPENRVWSMSTYPATYWHNLGLKTEFTTDGMLLATLGEASADSVPIKAVWQSNWFNLRRSSEIKYLVPTIIANSPLEVRLVVLSDHDGTAADIAEAEQTMIVQPDEAGGPGEQVALNERFAVDAVGESFQIRIEVTSTWAEIVKMDAGVL